MTTLEKKIEAAILETLVIQNKESVKYAVEKISKIIRPLSPLNIGDMLQAIDPCNMRVDGKPSLTIGNLYQIIKASNVEICVCDDGGFLHWFSIDRNDYNDYWGRYFKEA